MGVVKKCSFYPFKIAQNIRMSAERQLETVYSQPLQDAFQKMVEVMEDARRDLEVGIAEERVPPNYHTHPVVLNALPTDIVLPVMLYVDGVPITRRDGAVGFTLRSVLRPERLY